jgi:TP901 family phage tail tape measure protein
VSVVANVAINVDSSGAVSKLRQVQTQAQQTERAFGALQSAIGALGVGFALTKVIADVKELDTNLRRLGTAGVDVGKISPALSKLSDELGGVASKAELAAASYQAASAGFSDTAGNVNILRAATKAATGGLADTQAVTEVLVKTLNSYGMSGDQAIQVTDSISKAVELGNQEWSDYTSQLGRVASIAALAGVSLDEVNAFIASATKNGATAEIAFTGLGATLNTLLQPTKESQEAAAKLGIAWNYGGLQAKGFTGLMAELAVAMEKDKETTAKLLGSQEAMRGAFAANAKSGSDYKMVLGELSGAAGKTDADFQTMKGSLDNQLKALDTAFKSLSETLGIAFGPTVVKTITDTAAAINIVADALNAVPQPLKSATGEAAKFVIQMLLVQKAIQAIIALRAAFIGAMVGMTGATVASGAAATTSAGAFALYTANARTLQATSIAATASVSGLAGALLGLAGIGIITVGINYVITQTGAILGSSTAAGKSEAAGTPTSLAQQLKGKTAAQRKQMLAAAQKNLANDKKLASALALQIQMQDNAALSSNERALPSDRAKLTELQARINTGQSRIKAIQTTPIQRVAATGNALPTPIGATVGGGGGGGGGAKGKTDAERAADKAAREAERAAEAAAQEAARVKDVIRNRLAEGQIIAVKTQQQDRIAAAEAAGDKMLVARLQSQERELEIQYRYAQELAKEVNLDAQKAIIYEGLNALTANQVDLQRELDAIQTQSDQDRLTSLQKAIEKQYELNESVQNQLKLTDGIADTLGQGLGSAFSALISGAQGWEKSLQQIASGVLLDIANQLIRIFVIEQAINAIKTFLTPFSAATPLGAGGGMVGKFGTLGPNFGIPQRAKGGPVSSGQTYMVGERGPELFVPGRSGTIVANDKMGGGSTNVVVNVDAKGSSVEGDDQGANQLGRVISAAVQSELIKQQRPGGILAR